MGSKIQKEMMYIGFPWDNNEQYKSPIFHFNFHQHNHLRNQKANWNDWEQMDSLQITKNPQNSWKWCMNNLDSVEVLSNQTNKGRPNNKTSNPIMYSRTTWTTVLDVLQRVCAATNWTNKYTCIQGFDCSHTCMGEYSVSTTLCQCDALHTALLLLLLHVHLKHTSLAWPGLA